MVANLHLLMTQGGPDAYRLGHLEAGIATRRLYLAATSLNVGCLATAEFYDRTCATLPGPGKDGVGGAVDRRVGAVRLAGRRRWSRNRPPARRWACGTPDAAARLAIVVCSTVTVRRHERAGTGHPHLPAVTELRHRLHRIPELGYEEFKTAADDPRGAGRLGDRVRRPASKARRRRRSRDRRPAKPCVALRADIDALPIVEQTGLPVRQHPPRPDARLRARRARGHALGAAAVLKCRSRAAARSA